MSCIKNYFYYFSAIFTTIGTFLFAQIQAEPLIVGLQSGYPPFEYLDEKGKLIGFDVELAEIIAQKLGRKLVLKDMDFDGEILSLKQGKIDLIMSGMNITPSRQKEISMIAYHGEALKSLSLIFWGKIPSQVHGLEDVLKLPNGVVAVETGSVGEDYAQQIPQLKVKSFQGALAPLMDVKYGKSTANLVEPDVADYIKAKYPEVQILDIPLPIDQQILGYGIGIKKQNVDLQKKVETILAELKNSGELKSLEDQWFEKSYSKEELCSQANP